MIRRKWLLFSVVFNYLYVLIRSSKLYTNCKTTKNEFLLGTKCFQIFSHVIAAKIILLDYESINLKTYQKHTKFSAFINHSKV